MSSEPGRDARRPGATPAQTRLGAAYLRFAEPRVGADGVARPSADPSPATTWCSRPVKSASVLWALGGPEIRAQVEDAHHEAVRTTLAWIEQHAALTRTGHAGVAQVDTTGLGRDGVRPPRLPQRRPGPAHPCRGRQQGVRPRRQVAFARRAGAALAGCRGVRALQHPPRGRAGPPPRSASSRRVPQTDPGKRPVREIVGVPPLLLRHFSKRRAAIEDRYAELLSEYRIRARSRPPAARRSSVSPSRRRWRPVRARRPGGRWPSRSATGRSRRWPCVGPHGLTKMTPRVGRPQHPRGRELDDEQDRRAGPTGRADGLGAAVDLDSLERLRRDRACPPGHRFPTAAARDAATERVVRRATSSHLAIRIEEPELVAEPTELRRDSDGQSVFLVHGGERYTTSRTSEPRSPSSRLPSRGPTASTPWSPRPPSPCTSPRTACASTRASGTSWSSSPTYPAVLSRWASGQPVRARPPRCAR